MLKDPFLGYSSQRTGKEREIADARRRRDANVSASQPEDPRIGAAQKQLGLMMADFAERNPGINRENARALETMVNDFRNTCRRKGIELPKMKVVYFVRMNHMCVWPAEMEHAELQKRLVMFVQHRQRHNRAVDADDMAMGVRRAFPDYSPSRQLILPPSATKTQQETMQ